MHFYLLFSHLSLFLSLYIYLPLSLSLSIYLSLSSLSFPLHLPLLRHLSTDTEPADPLDHPAIKYLETFSNDKQNWKFAKSRQIYLVKHIYDDEKIPKKHFKMLLKYLEGLKGGPKTAIMKEAKENVKIYQEAEASGVEGERLKEMKKIFKRGEKLLALLS